MADVVSVNISVEKGQPKHPVPEICLRLRHGIVGDAHAGDWAPPDLPAGGGKRGHHGGPHSPGLPAYSRKISIRLASTWRNLPVGTRLRIGETVVEVTQIGKECHNDCAIRQAVGMCVMPTEGIFAVVVQEGTVRPGDSIEVLEAFS